jgi:hypothetical protein
MRLWFGPAAFFILSLVPGVASGQRQHEKHFNPECQPVSHSDACDQISHAAGEEQPNGAPLHELIDESTLRGRTRPNKLDAEAEIKDNMTLVRERFAILQTQYSPVTNSAPPAQT